MLQPQPSEAPQPVARSIEALLLLHLRPIAPARSTQPATTATIIVLHAAQSTTLATALHLLTATEVLAPALPPLVPAAIAVRQAGVLLHLPAAGVRRTTVLPAAEARLLTAEVLLHAAIVAEAVLAAAVEVTAVAVVAVEEEDKAIKR